MCKHILGRYFCELNKSVHFHFRPNRIPDSYIINFLYVIYVVAGHPGYVAMQVALPAGDTLRGSISLEMARSAPPTLLQKVA